MKPRQVRCRLAFERGCLAAAEAYRTAPTRFRGKRKLEVFLTFFRNGPWAERRSRGEQKAPTLRPGLGLPADCKRAREEPAPAIRQFSF